MSEGEDEQDITARFKFDIQEYKHKEYWGNIKKHEKIVTNKTKTQA